MCHYADDERPMRDIAAGDLEINVPLTHKRPRRSVTSWRNRLVPSIRDEVIEQTSLFMIFSFFYVQDVRKNGPAVVAKMIQIREISKHRDITHVCNQDE